MVKFFRDYPVSFSLVVLALIVIVSFGQSIGFTLWQDDNALIFKLQHLNEQAGVFGPGTFGLGAYRYIAVPYVPIYKIFGLNTTAFYIWALFFYFLASVSIFFLVRELTKNKLLTFLSGAIFSVGFIGSDGILRLFNSIQTSYSIIFVAFTFSFLYRFTRTKLLHNYFFTLSLFILALETAFVRTQYLIFPLVIFCLLFLSKRKMFLLLPFIGVYYFIFSRNYDPRIQLLSGFIGGIGTGQLQYLHGFFGSIGNIFIAKPVNDFLFSLAGQVSLDYGNRLLTLELSFLLITIIFGYFVLRQNKIVRFIFPLCVIGWFALHVVFFHDQDLIMRHSIEEDISGIFANFIGGLFLVTTGSLLLVIKDKKARLLLIFLLSWMLFNMLAYSIYLPFSPFETIHRYLTHSLAAYAIFIPLFVFYLCGMRTTIITASVIVLLNISFSVDYQDKFITEKSIPTRNFYTSLKQYVPEIKKESVFYFDIAEDEVSQQQFRDFFSVASMPDTTAIAIRYGIDRYDLSMTSNFEEFLEILRKKEIPQEAVFSFFYKKDELVNTTQTTRFNLTSGAKIHFDSLENVEFMSVTPVILEFAAKTKVDISINHLCNNRLSLHGQGKVLDYILSRDNFLSNAKISTSSQEKYQKSDLLLDGDINTLWRGNRGWWHTNEKEEIMLDIGKIKNITQVLWINGYANSTPIDYQLEVSKDSVSWHKVAEVAGGAKKANGMLVLEDFKELLARFVRMTIDSTYDNDAPAIAEIEAVESPFSEIDKSKTKVFEAEISCVKNENELKILREFVNKRGIKVNVSWETEKKANNVTSFLARADGLYSKYSFLLPAGGVTAKNLRIEPGGIPAEINLTDIRIIYPDMEMLNRLEEMESKR